jgi:hypothetical protein
MHSTSIWLDNYSDTQPKTNLKIIARPLTDASGITHTECRLIINHASGGGNIALFMTNAQAQQIIDTLTAHINEKNQQAIDQLMDEIDADPR